MTHSPPVQPISANRSGIGAVATMSLDSGTITRRNAAIPAAQAFVASTTFSAATAPRAVRTTGGRPPSIAVTGDRSNTQTPRSTATRRNPRASSAGCTLAAPSSHTPATWTAEPVRAATSSAVSRTKAAMPRASHARTPASQAPACSGVVAVQSQPARR